MFVLTDGSVYEMKSESSSLRLCPSLFLYDQIFTDHKSHRFIFCRQFNHNRVNPPSLLLTLSPCVRQHDSSSQSGPLDPPEESYLGLITDVDKDGWCASTSCSGLSCSGQKESVCWGLFSVAYWSTCVCGSRTVYVWLNPNKLQTIEGASHTVWQRRGGDPNVRCSRLVNI